MNGGYPPPTWLIGEWLAIHAGKHIGGRPGDAALLEGLTDLRQMAECVADDRGESWAIPVYSDLIPRIVTSAVVAVVKVTGVDHGEEAGWYNGVPSYGWRFSQVQVLPDPVPCKGGQDLWFLPDEVLCKVREQLGNRSGRPIPRQEVHHGA